jgi:hypothetical protein
LEVIMDRRAPASSVWDEDDQGVDFEVERLATADDEFERGVALQRLWLSVRSQELRSGRVTAMLAGMTIDLREAALAPEGATIHVHGALSGIEILVPPDWEVACEVDAVFGGVGEDWEGRWSADARPRLRIVGMVVAGGLSVR